MPFCNDCGLKIIFGIRCRICEAVFRKQNNKKESANLTITIRVTRTQYKYLKGIGKMSGYVRNLIQKDLCKKIRGSK